MMVHVGVSALAQPIQGSEVGAESLIMPINSETVRAALIKAWQGPGDFSQLAGQRQSQLSGNASPLDHVSRLVQMGIASRHSCLTMGWQLQIQGRSLVACRLRQNNA